MNSVRTLETEPIIKSAIRAECTIGRGIIVKIPKKLESLIATENGQYIPLRDIDGYSNVIVDVPERIPVTESLSIIENGQYAPPEGVDGFSDVIVNVPERIPDIEGLTVIVNGTYTSSKDGYNPVTVAVPERVPITESLSVTENGQYEPSTGVDGYDSVTVAVPERIPVTESLSVTENGTYEPDTGIDGYDRVVVAVPERVPVTESLSVTQNGTYTSPSGVDGYDRVVVDVPPTVPDIEPLTVTENGTYTADGDGYNPVVINIPPTIPEIEALTVTEDGVYTSSGDGYNPVTVSTGVASLRQEIQSAETASGCSPLADGITALTTYANEVTGQEDETLSDAVESLVQGFGGGNAKSVQVTAENELYQNATLVRDWLLSVVPQSSFAVIYRNDFVYNRQETRGQGTFLLGVIINNTPTLAMRFYSQLTVISAWSSNMWLSVDAGDAYTILYLD